MSTEKLKSDLVILKRIFPKNHKVFQILNATMDEITMKFIENGNEHIINGSFTEDNFPTIWFSKSDEVGSVLEGRTDVENPKEPTGILNEVCELLSQLCDLFECEMPVELEVLADEKYWIREGSRKCEASSSRSDNEEEFDNDELINQMEYVPSPPRTNRDIPNEGLIILDQLKKRYLKGNPERSEPPYSGINELDQRLIAEVQEIYRSAEYRFGTIQIEVDPARDMTREFILRLYTGRENQPLTEMMPDMVETMGRDYFLFRFRCARKYPFSRLTIDIISHRDYSCYLGVQLDSWRPTMSIRSVLMEIADKMAVPPVSRNIWGFKLNSNTLPQEFVDFTDIDLLSSIKCAFISHHNRRFVSVLPYIVSNRCLEN